MISFSNLSFPFVDRETNLPTILETFWETDHLPDEWVEWSESIDEIWLATDFLVEVFKRSGVKSAKLRKMPFGINRPKDLNRIFPEDNTVRFLFLSSFTYRKGIHFLIPAFLEEFNADENIELILRTSPFGFSVQEMNLTIKKLNQQIQKRSKPTIRVIKEFLPENKVWDLINSVDALISPSLGEGFNRPVAEAMMIGCPPITTNCPPMTEFVTDDVGFLIDHLGLVPVRNMENAGDFSKWFGSKYNHKWYQPSYQSIREQMRQCFEEIRSGEIIKKKEKLKSEYSNRWDWKNFLQQRLDRMEALSG